MVKFPKLPKMSKKVLLIGGVAIAGALGIAGVATALKTRKAEADEETIATEPTRQVAGSQIVKINYLPWTKALYLQIGRYHTPTLSYEYAEGEDIPLNKYNKLFTDALKDKAKWSPVYADYMDVLNTIQALYVHQHQVQVGQGADAAVASFNNHYKAYIPAVSTPGASVQQATMGSLNAKGLMYSSPSVYFGMFMPFPGPSTAAKEVLGNNVVDNRRAIVNVDPNAYRPDQGNIFKKILTFLFWNRKWKGPKYYTDIGDGTKLGCQGTFQVDKNAPGGYKYIDNNWFVNIGGWESSYHPATDRDLIYDDVARKESVWNPGGNNYQYPGSLMNAIKKNMDYEIDVVRQGNNVCYYTK